MDLVCSVAAATFDFDDTPGKAAVWALLIAPLHMYACLRNLHDLSCVLGKDVSVFRGREGIVLYTVLATTGTVWTNVLVPERGDRTRMLWREALQFFKTKVGMQELFWSPLVKTVLDDAADQEEANVLRPWQCRNATHLDDVKEGASVTDDDSALRLKTGRRLPIVSKVEDPFSLSECVPLSRALSPSMRDDVSDEDVLWTRVGKTGAVYLVKNPRVQDSVLEVQRFMSKPDKAGVDLSGGGGASALFRTIALLGSRGDVKAQEPYLKTISCRRVPRVYRKLLARILFVSSTTTDSVLEALCEGGFTKEDPDRMVSTAMHVWEYLHQPVMTARTFKRFLTNFRCSATEGWGKWLNESETLLGVICRTDAQTVLFCCRLLPGVKDRICRGIVEDGVCATRQHACIASTLIKAGMASEALNASWAETTSKYDECLKTPSTSSPTSSPPSTSTTSRTRKKQDRRSVGDGSVFFNARVVEEDASVSDETSIVDEDARDRTSLAAEVRAVLSTVSSVKEVHLIGSWHFYEAHDVDVVVEMADDGDPILLPWNDQGVSMIEYLRAELGWEYAHARGRPETEEDPKTAGRRGGAALEEDGRLLRTTIGTRPVDVQVVSSSRLREARDSVYTYVTPSPSASRQDASATSAALAVATTEALLRSLTTAQRAAIRTLHVWSDRNDVKGALYGRLPGIAVTILAAALARDDTEDRLTERGLVAKLLDALTDGDGVPRISLVDWMHAGRRSGDGPHAPLSVLGLDDVTVLTKRMTIGTTRMLYHVCRDFLTTSDDDAPRRGGAATDDGPTGTRRVGVPILYLKALRPDSVCRTAHVMLASMEQHACVDSVALLTAGDVYEVRMVLRSTADARQYEFEGSPRVEKWIPMSGKEDAMALCVDGAGRRWWHVASKLPPSGEGGCSSSFPSCTQRLPFPWQEWCVPNVRSLWVDMRNHVSKDWWTVVQT